MITKWLCVCINEKLRLFFVLIKLMYLSVDHKNICRNSVGLLVWCMIRKPNWRVFFFSWRSAVLSEVCVKRVYYIPLRFESRCSGQHIHTPIYLLCECKTSVKWLTKTDFQRQIFRLIKCLQKICVNYWNSQECHFNMFWTGANRKWEYRLYERQ